MLADVLEWVNNWWALAGEFTLERDSPSAPVNPWAWDGYVYQSTQLPDAVSGLSVKPLKDFLRAVVATWDASPINGPKPTPRELHLLSSEAWASYQALESHMQQSIRARKSRDRPSTITIGGQDFPQGSDIHLLWTWREALRAVVADRLPISTFDRLMLFPTREADGALLRLEQRFPVQVQRIYEFLKVVTDTFEFYLSDSNEHNRIAVWQAAEALLFRVDTAFGLIVDANTARTGRPGGSIASANRRFTKSDLRDLTELGDTQINNYLKQFGMTPFPGGRPKKDNPHSMPEREVIAFLEKLISDTNATEYVKNRCEKALIDIRKP